MIAAVVGAFLYIRVLISMFLEDAEDDAASLTIPRTVGVVIGAAVVVTMLFGIAPGLLDDIAQDALVELSSALTFEF